MTAQGLNATFCHLDDDESEGLKWETMAETLQVYTCHTAHCTHVTQPIVYTCHTPKTLQAAGVSWRVLQENDNFDDNAFEWFQTFIGRS